MGVAFWCVGFACSLYASAESPIAWYAVSTACSAVAAVMLIALYDEEAGRAGLIRDFLCTAPCRRLGWNRRGVPDIESAARVC